MKPFRESDTLFWAIFVMCAALAVGVGFFLATV